MWEQVVALLLQRKRMLGHFLETARPLGWQGDVLVLAVDPAHRGLIEHRDNRAPLVAALAEVYGRALDYRCVEAGPGDALPAPAPAAAAAARPAVDEVVPKRDVQSVQNVRVGQPSPESIPTPAPAPPSAAAPARKHPGELSPEARNTMLWLEGEIVGPARPNPPSSRGPG